MAILKNGILGTPKGKIGNVIGYHRNGSGIIQRSPSFGGHAVNSIQKDNAAYLQLFAKQWEQCKDPIKATLDRVNKPTENLYNKLLKSRYYYLSDYPTSVMTFLFFKGDLVNDQTCFLPYPPSDPFIILGSHYNLLVNRNQYPNSKVLRVWKYGNESNLSVINEPINNNIKNYSTFNKSFTHNRFQTYSRTLYDPDTSTYGNTILQVGWSILP